MALWLALAGLAGGCSGSSSDRTVEAGTPATTAALADARVPVVLPQRPSFDERAPHLFGPNGCYIDPANPERAFDPSFDCKGSIGAESGESPEAAPMPPTVTLPLVGYSGPLYSTTVSADPDAAPVVLEETVTIGDGATWSAIGLVRNDRASLVGMISVEATLRNADGTTLAALSADAVVPGVRPGEPVPFALRSDVAMVDVASVSWSAKAATAADPVDRNIEAGVFAIHYPDRKAPVNLGSRYADSGEPPYPYIVHITLHSLSDQSIAAPTLIVVWFNKKTGALVAGPTEASVQPLRLGLTPDGHANADIIEANPPAGVLSPSTDVAVWGYGK